MGDKNMADPLSGGEGVAQGAKMAGLGRARVDHGDLALAQDIAVGAVEGHRRWVGREDHAQARRKALHRAGQGADFRSLIHLALSLPEARR